MQASYTSWGTAFTLMQILTNWVATLRGSTTFSLAPSLEHHLRCGRIVPTTAGFRQRVIYSVIFIQTHVSMFLDGVRAASSVSFNISRSYFIIFVCWGVGRRKVMIRCIRSTCHPYQEKNQLVPGIWLCSHSKNRVIMYIKLTEAKIQSLSKPLSISVVCSNDNIKAVRFLR